MILFPNAKVNLGLNVVAKRSDGYHDIETLFVPCTQLFDILEVVEQKESSLHLYGIPVVGDVEDNLCMKAYRLLQEKHSIPAVGIQLYKKIPMGAGLGGGSSDAANTLIAINKLFSLDLSDDTLAEYAAQLGSDCPFFIYNVPMFATGRGEILRQYDISLSQYRIEIVSPSVFVSTKEAYQGLTPHKPEVPLLEALSRPIEEWKDVVVNDFEESIFKKYPILAKEKEALYERGALYASMSGSGSSLFGIFGS